MTRVFPRASASASAVAFGFALSFFAPLAAAQTVQPEDTHARAAASQAVTARRFMVATANAHATRVGYDVLAAGGSAMDAAVAVQMMLNLVEPQSSGIGGGAFLLYWDAAAGRLQTFDGRETAPSAATPDYFLGEDGQPVGFWQAVVGGRSVGVPGTLRLLELAHRLHGRRPWAELLQPAIERSRAGFEISPRLAAAIEGSAGEPRQLEKYARTRAYFFTADGAPKPAGTVLRNPEFAATLSTIAERGADALYQGLLARQIVSTVRATRDNPGILSEQDLAGYRVKLREPVCIDYRGYDVCGMGPPTSGGLAVAQILGVLAHFDLPGMGPGVDAVHLFAEAAKLAYADRGLYLADSDYVSVPTAGLLDPAYLTARAQLVDRDQAMASAPAGNPPWRSAELRSPHVGPEQPGTSHFAIVDADGNAVSMTTTIETGFGSRLMVGGFLLNNELTDFSRSPEADGRPVANRVEGGKRPRSSMAPTIVLKNGRPYLVLGSPGGSRIINYVAKTVVAVLDWGLDPQQAIELGHFVNRNGATDLEAGTEAAALQAALEARGHEVKVGDLNSGLHAILIEPGRLTGGADPRREGLVMGD